MWYGDVDLGEQLRTMTVTATSPDGAIRATVTGENRLELRFQPRTYQWYDDHGLARELTALGTTTWVAWTRQRAEVTRLSLGQSRGEAEQSQRRDGDPRHDRFIEALRRLECDGVSRDRSIHLRLAGATRWQVEIADGTARNTPERTFVEQAVSAVDSVIQDRSMKMALLRAEHFDIGVPSSWLDRVRSLRFRY
ncbi:hypothetical protein ACWT_0862 [Actinoplanes sp. SE50]|nr:hypothetical protein ACPL_979 [Actinoplanes sp. SE50/110]ATO80277.1 hypothetical protein ACWT_0862 [Actinoplanes sp. SE50]SLL97682.1 hypothetical protein ACSP50_0891 [Actinoplanes sp. SE50/110]